MSLRLSSRASFSTLAVAAASLLLLANCTSSANIATGGSGGTGGTTTTTTTGSGAGTQRPAAPPAPPRPPPARARGRGWGDQRHAPRPAACAEPITPGFCTGGTPGDATQYPCGPGLGDGCCFPGACASPCTTLGATRCIAGVLETCGINPDTNCAPTWFAPMPCSSGQTCNSDATKCVDTAISSCTSDADCGCGCGCGAGECHCTGGIPPTCTTAADCGAPCTGLLCTGGQCVAQACTPGIDQTCNEDASMNSLAGTCSVDGVCKCNTGFTMKADGKCG